MRAAGAGDRAVTNELIERAAMAMHDAAGTAVPWKDLRHGSKGFVVKLVRAALLEMRYPTDAMLAAGTAAMQPSATPEEVWAAMIDAGLAP